MSVTAALPVRLLTLWGRRLRAVWRQIWIVIGCREEAMQTARRKRHAQLPVGPGPSRARSIRADHTKAGPIIRLAGRPVKKLTGGAGARWGTCLIGAIVQTARLTSKISAFSFGRDINSSIRPAQALSCLGCDRKVHGARLAPVPTLFPRSPQMYAMQGSDL